MGPALLFCGADAMTGIEVILLDLGVFILAAFGVGLALYRFTKSRRKTLVMLNPILAGIIIEDAFQPAQKDQGSKDDTRRYC